MENSTGLIIAVIILLLILNVSRQSGFTANKDQIFNDIMDNKDLFSGEQYSKLKHKFDWMDAGIYNDVKQLIRKDQCNKGNLDIIFRKTV